MQKRLDVFADEQFTEALLRKGECCYIASEEHEYGIDLAAEGDSGKKYMAFIMQQAGGRAIARFKRILELLPRHSHQRTPIAMGSPYMVAELERYMHMDYAEAKVNESYRSCFYD